MTCLRCGRTVSDQILLCPECRTPKKRLHDPNAALTQEEQLQKQISSLQKRIGRQKHRIIFLVLICLLTVSLLGYAIHTLLAQNARLSSQNTLIKSQEVAIQEAQNALEQANLTIDTQRDILTEAQETIAKYYTGLNP